METITITAHKRFMDNVRQWQIEENELRQALNRTLRKDNILLDRPEEQDLFEELTTMEETIIAMLSQTIQKGHRLI